MNDFEVYDDHVLLDNHPPREYLLWRFLAGLVVICCVMFAASFAVCMANDQCRSAIPTAHVLLTSVLTAPYMVLALSSGLYVFFITCLGIYVKTEKFSVVVAGAAVYATVGAILVVFPFTGWDKNWAILLFIAAYFVWMIVVAAAVKRDFEKNLKTVQRALIVLYALCGIAWAVLKFVTTPHVQIGRVVVESAAALMIVAYMTICLSFVWRIKIRVIPA